MLKFYCNYGIITSIGVGDTKDLYIHLEETLNKVDFLIEENKAMKKEIATLKINHQKEILVLMSRIDILELENKKFSQLVSCFE